MEQEDTQRPKGCYFDVYGWDEESLESLTCHNCPLPAMICDYKGWAVLQQIADRMRTTEFTVVSDK